MNKLLKIIVGLVVLVIVVLTFYLEKESHTNSDGSLQTYSPSIKIIGRDVDTAYLFADYKDQGAEYLFDTSNALDCSRYRSVTKKTGAVNTRIPGVYYITYYADDILGNPITPQTRTVSVVENDAGFLNGAYDVSFSQ
ncbi:MAG: DUF5011 domain-containing protein, partial [Bacteroidia bacterium]|nr:DUF5011 domain-containing protein [Bacteroidia bacterium]